MKKNLELTDQQLNVILFGLQKLPYETSVQVINDIIEQLKTQNVEIKNDINIAA
jgi:hypothetical protein